jgi:hypothetical protein
MSLYIPILVKGDCILIPPPKGPLSHPKDRSLGPWGLLLSNKTRDQIIVSYILSFNDLLFSLSLIIFVSYNFIIPSPLIYYWSNFLI